MIVKDVKPFSVVEDEGLRNFDAGKIKNKVACVSQLHLRHSICFYLSQGQTTEHICTQALLSNICPYEGLVIESFTLLLNTCIGP